MSFSAAPRSDVVVLIPARMQASRLPGKPLALIGDHPMIRHVFDRAREAGIGEVVVATDHQGIADAAASAGARVVMTSTEHPSGSDRIFEALKTIDPDRKFSLVVNLQGDLPTINPALIRSVIEPLEDPAVAIATLAVEITEHEENNNPNVVKVAGPSVGPNRFQAEFFTRAAVRLPAYHHIGIYAYQRKALERFVGLPQSESEKREKLEQLRALDAGMRIDVVIVDAVPLGVDTPADLEKARVLLAGKNRKT